MSHAGVAGRVRSTCEFIRTHRDRYGFQVSLSKIRSGSHHRLSAKPLTQFHVVDAPWPAARAVIDGTTNRDRGGLGWCSQRWVDRT